MELVEFYKRVEEHPELAGVHVDSEFVIVECVPKKIKTKIDLVTIENNSWCDLELVLVCEREALQLKHMTRVVGYYSLVQNWNKSKVGERNDRQKGNYAIKEHEGLADSTGKSECTDGVCKFR